MIAGNAQNGQTGDVCYVIVIVQLSGIYGSKLTKSEGDSPRTRFVYVTINPR